ncbi:MAG: endonuclease [Chitinophagales bacterium]
MKHKQIYILFAALLSGFSALAGPGTYYNSLDTTRSCANFKTQLFHLISTGTTQLPYSQVDNYYDQTDLKPAESGGGFVIVDRYSSENPNGLDYCSFRYPTSFCMTTPSDTNQCICYNKEHTFPKAYFGGDAMKDIYSDIHYIWPADNRINYYKSNFPIGYNKNPYYTSKNGSSVGISDATMNYGYNSSNIFEPIDSFKGDFARAYLYVVTRYEDSLPGWIGRSTANNVLDGNKYPGLDPWILKLCVKWHKMDPPSAFERQRNDAIFALQGNRNPYIDYPNWVEKVFGTDGVSTSCVNTAIVSHRTVDFSVFPNPANSELNIRLDGVLSDKVTLEVLDMVGKKIRTEQFPPNAQLHSIDISGLPNGVYFINLLYKGENNITPLFKQ